MAIDRTTQDPEAARWRDTSELRALRDMVEVYRRGAVALAGDVSALRAEAERLRGALRDARVLRGGELIEVEIELDADAQDLVSVILVAELPDLGARDLEDVLLVARELTVEAVNRSAMSARAVVRVVRSPTSLRIEVQALGRDPEPARVSIVERLSERWGTERASSGASTVWAQLPSDSAG